MFRWSWRDLRANWGKVIAIALVIAIGTGGYAGLTSNANWRRASYDASFAALAMYDIRVKLPTGGFIEEGALTSGIGMIEHGDWIVDVEERLIIPTQVEATTPDDTVLVRAEITGSDFSAGGPHVNSYHAFSGRLLDASDSGASAVMIERNFARFHGLAPVGAIGISGGRSLDYVAQATTPEYFTVAPEGEIFLSEASFAAVFTTLETAQDLAGHPGMVNDAVLTLVPESDRDVVVSEVESALAGVGIDVMTRDDNVAYSSLTRDVDNDQQMFNALAFLLFAGAVVAAFILIHRLAQQQRREIGVSMALGVEPWKIAVRPMLVSAQIALLGVLLGIGVGTLIGSGFQTLLEGFIPLPIWETEFQAGLFASVAVVGFILPFVATAIPIWRAVRVAPVDAIKPTHLTVSEVSGRRRTHRRLSTFVLMPFRNLRRAPWRTSFTILAIAFVLTALVAFFGIMDSLTAALDLAESEDAGDAPDRIVVSLDSFYPADSPEVQVIAAAKTVAIAEPTLRVGASVRSSVDEFDLLLELSDLDEGIWRPTITNGSIDTLPGLVIAEKAAGDLDVEIGEMVTLRHPARTGPASFGYVESELPVLATHPHPTRTFAYVDVAHAELMGMGGIANLIQVDPAPTASEGDVQRELFDVEAVASVQSVTASTRAVKDQMAQVTAFIQMMAFIVLLMALLIAYLTASISLDARAREQATMFAYGVRVRTVMGMAMTESLVIGVVATVLGVAGGIAAVWWMTSQLLSNTLPDFGIAVALRPETVVLTLLLGIGVVAVAPLFALRRMRRMDVPGTLRLVE
jgi:putative ABC transport system permease protein